MMASPNAVGSVDDLSVFHPDDTARFIGHRGVVSAGDNGDAKGGTQVAQHAHHRLPRTVVEIGRRLVGEDKRRIADQRPRDRGALLFAARHLRGLMVDAMSEYGD